MSKRPFVNRLNDLDPKTWLKFQKSWFVHAPPPRKKGVLRHPAKFPETLAQEFIEFFTKREQVILDPMVGTGSTLVAALRAGRHSIGIELNDNYAEISKKVDIPILSCFMGHRHLWYPQRGRVRRGADRRDQA